MIEHFKEQLDAGPQCLVYYIVESDSGRDMLQINGDAIENLAEKYVCIDHSTAVPVLKLKEE